jgi:hypothetical protein
MGFWMTLFAFIGTFVIGQLFRPKPKLEDRQPSALGDFRVPTAEEGRAISALVGIGKITGGNTLWYGDLVAVAIKEKVRTGIFSSKKVVVGHRYYMTLQLALCHGVLDELIEVRCDDRPLPPIGITIKMLINDRFNFDRDDAGTGSPELTAVVRTAKYYSYMDLMRAVSRALISQGALDPFDFGDWKAVYSFHIANSFNDRIWVEASDQTGGNWQTYVIEQPAQDFTTGAALAAALTAKCAEVIPAARLTLVIGYDEGDQKFDFTPTFGASGLRYAVYADDVLAPNYDTSRSMGPTLGLDMGDEYPLVLTGNLTDPFQAPFVTSAKRVKIAVGGQPELRLDFTAANSIADELGFDHALYVGDCHIQAPHDVEIPGVVDYGHYWEIPVDAPNFFGGDDREGGVKGTIVLYKGTAAQMPDAHLEGKVGKPLPGYRHLAYALFRGSTPGTGFYFGNSPYIKDWAFIVGSRPNGLFLNGAQHIVDGDSNPVAALHQLLFSGIWGVRAVPNILQSNWHGAAATLFEEKLGVSFQFDQAAPASELADEILRHIDGVTYVDPQSGLLMLKLARADYDLEDLFELNPSNFRLTKFARPSWADTRNVVKLLYTDRANGFIERVARAEDLASIQAQGGAVSEEAYPFRGLGTAAAAQKRAANVLMTTSYPLALIEGTGDRSCWKLRPGDVAKLTWPPLGIVDMPVRVSMPEDGTLLGPEIRLELAEDIFGVPWTVFTAPGDTEWGNPERDAEPPAAAALLEAPYATVVGADILVIALCAADAEGFHHGYTVHSDPSGGTEFAPTNEVSDFSPTGVLDAPVGYTDMTLVIEDVLGIDALESVSDVEFATGVNVLLLGAELIAFKTVVVDGDGVTLTGCVRGVMDTTPVPHAAGDRVWFLSDGFGLVSPQPYPADITLTAKLAPFTAQTEVPLAELTALEITTDRRAARPYVPCAVRLNGEDYPESITGELTVSWSFRNRLGEWQYDDAGATGEPEPGTHYRVKVYGDGGVLKHTEDNLVTTSWTYPTATELAENGGSLNGVLRVVLEAVQDDGDELVSFQAFDLTVDRFVGSGTGGYGTGYGNNYGG